MLALRPLVLSLLAFLLVGGATFGFGQRGAEVAIATSGFDRPRPLAEIDSSGDAKVAVATGAQGPVAIWEDGRGILARPLARPNDPPTRLHESRGVRALWAGGAGGDPLVIWAERDLVTGGTEVRWRWRDEVRTAFPSQPAPTVIPVRGAAQPRIVSVRAGPDGYALTLHDWDGTERLVALRPDPVHGPDALLHDGALRLAWLEGRTETVLGRVFADWSAYLATVPLSDLEAEHGPLPEPLRLGEASRTGTSDVARIAARSDGLEVAFATERGPVARTPSGELVPLGPGVVVGATQDGWLLFDEERMLFSDGQQARWVVRWPSRPEHVAYGEAAGITGLVTSTGRYLGGLEVWTLHDAEAYENTLLERFAAWMGWDPWRPFESAAGHLALALLAAVLLAMAFAPAWWAIAAVAARFGPPEGRRVRTESAAVGAATVALVALAGRWISPLPDAANLSLFGTGPEVLASALIGAAFAWLLTARSDLEATFGRLFTIMTAATAGFAVLAFVTMQAWLAMLQSAAG